MVKLWVNLKQNKTTENSWLYGITTKAMTNLGSVKKRETKILANSNKWHGRGIKRKEEWSVLKHTKIWKDNRANLYLKSKVCMLKEELR